MATRCQCEECKALRANSIPPLSSDDVRKVRDAFNVLTELHEFMGSRLLQIAADASTIQWNACTPDLCMVRRLVGLHEIPLRVLEMANIELMISGHGHAVDEYDGAVVVATPETEDREAGEAYVFLSKIHAVLVR